ncbi:MAG TPA: hypothetical protein VN695_01885 [Streptosporangiaceae bacterium]|nr:hypothetical protein [Streptosporangiaceae bacterium]
MTTTVNKADIEPLAFLAQGGFGKVYRVEKYQLPKDPTPLAYKEFTSNEAEQAQSAKKAVDFRESLDQADRAELDSRGTWPRALVKDGGKISGLLMPLIPADFFCELADQTGDPAKATKKPRDLAWLITTAEQRNAAKVNLGEVDHAERLLVLAHLIYAIGRLHKLGWVFGDVSFKNAVFALNPPRLMLLDCDGAAALGDKNRQQFSTPYWDPPECPIALAPGQPARLQDKRSDTYKLALAILRCLTPGKGAGTVRAPSRFSGELDAAGVALVTKALSDDPGQRPSAKELYEYLYQAVQPLIKVPEILAARLVSHAILRGQDARIEWAINKASEVTIIFGNNSRQPVDLASHPQGFGFRPDVSGPVSIEIRNRYVTTNLSLGDLLLYELPEFKVDLNFLPRPQVPAIDAFSLAPIAAMLTGRPHLKIGAIDMPRIPSPSTFELVEKLVPQGLAPVPAPRIDEAVIDVSNTLKNMILTAGSEYGAALRQAKLGV